ncbi:MAG: hypothetical protein ACTSV2_01350 [Candidatus Thorarchaeota archaeon]
MSSPTGSPNPSKLVLDAFRIRGDVTPLSGASKRAYLAGNTILKYSPESNEVELVWLSNLLGRIQSHNFRLQKFIKSNEGHYLVDGWLAYDCMPGEFFNDIDYLRQKRNVLQLFHTAIKNEPLPPHLMSEKKDPWTIADRMAWGEQPIICHERLRTAIGTLVDFVEPLDLPNQLIQGDPENVLFSDDAPPALIDISWHFRPADFSLAVLAVDVVSCWCKGKCMCLDSGEVYSIFEDIDHIDQLLLRAILRRVLELEGLRKYDETYLETVSGLLPAIKFVSTLF